MKTLLRLARIVTTVWLVVIALAFAALAFAVLMLAALVCPPELIVTSPPEWRPGLPYGARKEVA